MVPLGNLANGEEVAQTLGHLLAVKIDKSVVHPSAHVLATGSRFTLRDLVGVVRKDEIPPPAMNVEGIAEVATGHR